MSDRTLTRSTDLILGKIEALRESRVTGRVVAVVILETLLHAALHTCEDAVGRHSDDPGTQDFGHDERYQQAQVLRNKVKFFFFSNISCFFA